MLDFVEVRNAEKRGDDVERAPKCADDVERAPKFAEGFEKSSECTQSNDYRTRFFERRGISSISPRTYRIG
jgi:hypothetical protein